MLSENLSHNSRLGRICETFKPKQEHARVDEPLTEHQLAKVLVGRYEQSIAIVGLPQDVVIRHAPRQLGNVDDSMTVIAKALHHWTVDAFIGDDVHADLAPIGYTTSARSACAAKRRAASTPSRVKRG